LCHNRRGWIWDRWGKEKKRGDNLSGKEIGEENISEKLSYG